MNWYLKTLNQYADFKGRARRKEYWMFVLFNAIFTYAAIILNGILGINTGFKFLYSLVLIIPGLTVGLRRLHDAGKADG